MKLTFIIMATLLVGCFPNTKQITQPTYVYLPVYDIPDNVKSLPVHTRPFLSIQTLTEQDKDDYNKIINSMNTTILQLQQYSEDLESNDRIYKSFISKSIKNAELQGIQP